MPRKLKLRDASGFVTISSEGGQIQTTDAKGFAKPISTQGNGFVAHGDVFQGELVYLNSDGTVSVPGSVDNDPNKADNIIGVFLSDADDGEEVQIVTKGSVTISSLNLRPRTIYYIDARGKLTTTTTPYIFGKSLTSNSIMVDISFMQSILNIYGITPTFDKLTSVWNADSLSINISWTSEDRISKFEIPSIGLNINYNKEPKSSPFSQEFEDYIESYGISNLASYVAKITNEKNVSTEFSFQVLGGLDDDSKIQYEYSGLGRQYSDGDGLFLDTNIFARTKVHLFLYSNGEWSFGDDNNLPIRKLFVGSFVQKDESGQYVVIVFDKTQLKLYSEGKWSFYKATYTNIDFTLSDVRAYKIISSSLQKTSWDCSMVFYTIGDIKKGSQVFYKTKTESYEKLNLIDSVLLYAGKFFASISKTGLVTGISTNETYDYSKSNETTLAEIKKSFDKYVGTSYESDRTSRFLTIGTREVGKTLYYYTTSGRIESIGILGLELTLSDGDYDVSVGSDGVITKITQPEIQSDNLTFTTTKRIGKKVSVSTRTSTGYWKLTYRQETYGPYSSSKGFTSFNDIEIKTNEQSSMRVISCDVDGNPSGQIFGINLNQNQVNSIDLSNAGNIKYLDLGRNILESVNLSNCNNLLRLNLSRNLLTKIDISNLSNLLYLNLGYNRLENFDTNSQNAVNPIGGIVDSVDHNPIGAIVDDIGGIGNIDGVVSQEFSLKLLYLRNNSLSTCSVGSLPSLRELNLKYNSLSEFNSSNLGMLEKLYLDSNKLEAINLSQLSSLTLLTMVDNGLSSVDLSNTQNLVKLKIGKNQLTTLNASGLYNIEDLYLQNNPLEPDGQDLLINSLNSNTSKNNGHLRAPLSQRTDNSQSSYDSLIERGWRIVCTDCPDVNVDPMSGYLSDDTQYLDSKDGLYLLSELTRPNTDIPEILNPIDKIKPEREVKEELFR